MSDDIIKRLRDAIAAGPTPGPWVVYDDSNDGKTNRIEIVALGKTVARIYRSVPEEDLPNARLIAAASPDNIAALLDRLDAAERERDSKAAELANLQVAFSDWKVFHSTARLEAENARLRAVVSALAFQASRDPFVSVGHWCEHGPCAAIIRDISNPNADHHGPDWTERDSEYLK